MNQAKVISFRAFLPEFHFLGVENTLRADSDFGAFWSSFFGRGGYDPIAPYESDPSCLNVWYCSDSGKAFYCQGKAVHPGTPVPDGYTLMCFPACEYLVVTTEWLESYEASMQHINHNYWKNAVIPEGFEVHPDTEPGVFLMERWGANTGEGYRYEFWLPLRPCIAQKPA